MLHIFFNYTELHRLKEAVFVLHMVNVGLEEDRRNWVSVPAFGTPFQ